MGTEQDKNTILASMKNIYLEIESPVVLCDEGLKCIWKNKMASKLLDKVNLDLILSKDNADYIKKLMIKNKHGVFNASFLPFLGCKINIIPVRYNDFLGAVLMFEAMAEIDFNFDKTDNIVSILSSNLRLPMHLITNAVDILNY